MVQRKTPDKLCIPAETKKNYVKSDKRSTTHKPASSSSSSHHQDIKNKGGTDLKTKLKKSRSLKLLDFESLESSPVKEEKSKTFKSPTADLSAATTPQRSSMIKASECSPNYMKSTSSSNARKERSPVISSRSSQTSSDSGNQKRNSNHSKSSSLSPDEEPAITKNTSLKPVRTLTKSSSMKSVKPLMKKGSGVALNQDLNAGRATCSSTLKDSKFPDYLMISPGGTESEGTSVMKVCPYTYCSLNGHHHAPLPPLKCFMSARRRSLRTQRSLRLRCLSPVGTKISAKTKKKIDTGQMDFDGDSAIVEADSTGSLISPQIEEIGMDFFVEIYAKPRENVDGLIIGRSEYDEDEKEKMDVTVIPEAREDFLSSVKDGAETELENGGKPSKSNPNESSLSEISFEDVLDQNSDFLLTEMDISEHNQQEEVEETEYPPYSEQAEADLECCCIGTKSESIVLVETELDESVAEPSEMDWEEGEVETQLVKDGSDSSNLTTGDKLQEAFEEKITNSDAETVDSESYGGDLILEIDVSSDTRGEGSITFISVNKDQVSFTEDSSEEQTAISEEKDDDNEPEDFNSGAIFISSVEDPFAEVTSASEEKNEISETEDDFIQGNFLLEDDELFCTAEATDMNQKEEEDFQDDATIDQSLSLGNLDTYAEVGPQLSEPEDTSFLPEDELLCTAEATDRNQKEEEDFQDDALIDQRLSLGNLDINAEVGPQLSEPEDTSFLPEDDELFCTAEATDMNQKEKEDFQDDALIDQSLSLGNLDINAEVGPQLSEPEDTSFLPEDDELCTVEATDRNQKEEEDFQNDTLIDQSLSLGNLDINAEVGPQLSEPEDISCTIGSQTFEAVISKTDQDLATSDISMDQSLPTADDGVGAEEIEQVDQDSGEKYNNESAQMHTEIEVSQCDPTQEDDKCGTAVETLLPPTQGESYDDESSSSSMVENQELPVKDQREGMDLSFSSSTHAEEHNDPESYKLVSAETGIIEDIQVEDKVVTDATEMCLTQSNVLGGEEKKKMINARRVSHPQVTENSCSNLKISIRRKEQHIEKREELREFNPREPNYLDVVPDPEAEKVDLKQQMMDERKNSEEWMLDYALRKAVNELAPARKRRVALLVEAFETVTPQPKCESRIRHVMPVFSHTRPMQACI